MSGVYPIVPITVKLLIHGLYIATYFSALCDASITSVKIIKNEVRCRDDTVPKTVDTRKHCKVGLRACNNLPQPRKTKM